MAVEKPEPKSGIIIQIAIASIVAVVAVRFGVVSLYHQTVDDEYHRKFDNAGLEEIRAQRATAETKLVHLDRAGAEYAKLGRGAGANAIFPADYACESVDSAPQKGWTHTPTGYVAKACPVVDAGAASDASDATDAGAAAADGSAGNPAAPAAVPPHN